jgi:glutathione synthase/RimK-type ligase-like ATP-grasp enzyme
MILLWGIATDGPLASVRAALLRMGAAVAFLDQRALLRSTIELTLDGGVRGRLETPDWSADLASVSAVYLRPYDARRMDALRGVKPTSGRFRRALEFEDALACWMEMTPALVVSRPSAMASNNSKPYQLGLISAAGFDVPDTLVTTDPSAAAEFWEKHGTVIYKSVSGFRSIVSRLRPEHRERLPDVANCPTQFQQHIEGVDYRVHVVGGEVFGCQVSSSADDYRYPRPSEGLLVEPCEVPRDIAERCRRLADSLNLPVAGVDLRRTHSGRWYCFEANPSPGFSFYEEAAGQPIGEAIAGLLARAGTP